MYSVLEEGTLANLVSRAKRGVKGLKSEYYDYACKQRPEKCKSIKSNQVNAFFGSLGVAANRATKKLTGKSFLK